jgi:3-oxoacyl-[acyl-carrier-protein] synthase II
MGQRATAIAAPLAITGCGVLSSIGIGFEAFSDALCAGRSGRTAVANLFAGPLPEDEACVISEFEVSKFLGKKGTSFFDRITSLAVVTCGLALQASNLVVSDENRQRIGIVLGTSMGSVKSASDFSRETLVQDRPYLVNPILFPSTILNCASGQAAIWHSLKGANTTVSGGQLSSLMAFRYAGIVIRQGYADAVLAGGVEEFTPHSAWGSHHAGTLKGTGTLVGEGCAVFVLEDAAAAHAAGRVPLAEILACEIGNYGELSDHLLLARGLATCIQRALARAGAAPDQVWAISSGATGRRVLDRVEEEGVRLALSRPPARWLRVKKVVGECYSAAGALQLAALLSSYRTNADDCGRVSLVLSVGEDGGVGCAVVKGGC